MATPINSLTSSMPATALARPAAGDSNAVYNDLSSLTRLKSQSHVDPAQAIKEVSKQFESIFVTMMMKSMRETLPKDGMFDSSAMQSYQDMSDQQLALTMSHNGSLGLAKVIEKQLSSTIAPGSK